MTNKSLAQMKYLGKTIITPDGQNGTVLYVGISPGNTIYLRGTWSDKALFITPQLASELKVIS